MIMKQTKIFFLGAGKMATAMVGGMLNNFAKDQISAFDKSTEALNSFISATGVECKFTMAEADIVVLAVKPQHLAEAAAANREILAGKTIVSIIAGMRLAQLHEVTGSEAIVRVMPNLPALIGKGVSGVVFTQNVGDAEFKVVAKILDSIGSFECFDNEKQLDIVTGLSGSGPAYVFDFIQALTDGAVTAGMPRVQAQRLAAGTVLGAAQMVMDGGDPAVSRNQVMSPGGTTAAGIRILEQKGFRSAVIEAVIAATEKSRELGKQG